ncbi:MAG: hypothetical protein AB7F20_13995, partial [Geoalkalibacter sp.]|uniref:hypothetical protein n=1 Tax=Geoalkalibacter sp. TaxID=3041440 RepID=UPI003D14F697
MAKNPLESLTHAPGAQSLFLAPGRQILVKRPLNTGFATRSRVFAATNLPPLPLDRESRDSTGI